MDDDVRTSWERYVDAERRWLGARTALVRDHPELDAVLASALATVTGG